MKTFIALLVLTLTACGGSGGNAARNPNVGPGIGAGHAKQILGMAEFELGCPKEEIQLTKVAQYRVGAVGCGRRVLYVGTHSGWIANTSDAAVSAASEPPPSSPATQNYNYTNPAASHQNPSTSQR